MLFDNITGAGNQPRHLGTWPSSIIFKIIAEAIKFKSQSGWEESAYTWAYFKLVLWQQKRWRGTRILTEDI